MIQLPRRLEQLAKRLEAGEPITRQDVDRVAALQALDLANAGRQFIEDWAAREDVSTKALEAAL